MVHLPGWMVIDTRGSLRTTTLKVTEDTLGLTVVNTRVFGRTTRCMAEVLSFGQTVGNMRGSIRMRRNKVMGSLAGRMVEPIRVNGVMENKMAEVFIVIKKESKELVSGTAVKKLSG